MDSAIQAINNDLTNRNLSGYQLTTLLIRNGKKLGLKSSELLVFTALSSYWNGRPVYPKITTLSENTALSDKAVRTALNGLLEKGYIIKSKRGKNANIYNLNVNAVLLAVESGKNDRTSAVKSTAPCNMKLDHEKLEKTTTNKEETKAPASQKNVVAFQKKSFHKIVRLDDVPPILREKKGIDNPCAYWASLSAEVKNEYLQKQKKKEELAAKKLKRAEEEKAAKAAAAAELERIKNEPPFWQTCDRAAALEHLKLFAKPNLRPLLRKGYRAELIKKYNIELAELLT